MSKVKDWVDCDLRYVAEKKLARLTDDELVELHQQLANKHKLPHVALSGDRTHNIGCIMTLKSDIDTSSRTSSEPLVGDANDLSDASKAFDALFAKEDAAADDALCEDTPAEMKAKEARVEAFIQLAAAATPPAATPPTATPPAATVEHSTSKPPVTIDTHRLRVCSFNACKMRLGNANTSYTNASDDMPSDEREGTQKGADLAQKWLTLAALMADFDVIMLQEIPGAENVLNEKIETFAAMLDVATEEGRVWTAVTSQKSGKGGKEMGQGAEVHVCFVKSPVQLKDWNTLRKVGATELDYAPLQVVLHDERFEMKADRDFVITSVHLPPSHRHDARDSQIAALLRNYSAPDTSECRMQLPFTPNRETGAAPVHIICGDFNTYPGDDRYKMQSNGFVSKIPKNAATTSGNENYDNVLVNAHANEDFIIGGGIMQLKDPHNAATSNVGISDHFPVFVEVQEVKKTQSAAGRAQRAGVNQLLGSQTPHTSPVRDIPATDKQSIPEPLPELEPIQLAEFNSIPSVGSEVVASTETQVHPVPFSTPPLPSQLPPMPPVPDLEWELVPEPEPKTETEPEPEPKTETEPEPDPAPAPEPEPEPDPAPEPETDPAPAPEPESEPESEPEPEPETEKETEFAPAPEPEKDPETELALAPETEPEPELALAPETEPEPEPELALAPETEPEQEPEQE